MPPKRKRHCVKGHALTPKNRYGGDGPCRACARERARDLRAERRMKPRMKPRDQFVKRRAEVARDERQRMDERRRERQERLAERLANDPDVRRYRDEKAEYVRRRGAA